MDSGGGNVLFIQKQPAIDSLRTVSVALFSCVESKTVVMEEFTIAV